MTSTRKRTLLTATGTVLVVLVAVTFAARPNTETGTQQAEPAGNTAATGRNTTLDVARGATFPSATGASGVCVETLCLDRIDEIADTNGVEQTLAMLRSAVANDPAGAGACHPLAHQIGRWAALELGNVADALAHDDGGCLGGYQHGVLEGWSMAVDLDQLRTGLRDACATYRGQYALGSCSHGLGHAIALQRPGSVQDALDVCDMLDNNERQGCAGGVLMAYASTSPSQDGLDQFPPLPLDGVDVLTLCSNVAEQYAAECYGKLWLFGQRLNVEPVALAAACLNAGALAEPCARGIGTGLYYTGGLEPDTALGACATIDTTLRDGCVSGVAWSNANAWVGSNEAAGDYKTMCGTVDETQRTECVAAEREGLAGAS